MSKSMDMTNLKGVYAEAMQERNRQEGRNSRMDEKRAKTAERQNGGRDSRMKTEKLRMPTMNTGHGGPDPVRREKLRVALIAKLMSKYHPGIAQSKTEKMVHKEVDELMKLRKVSEQDLHEIEAKVRKVSNEEVAFLVTNPFKRVTAFKSGAKDEWAQMNDMVVKAGREAEYQNQQAQRNKKTSFKRLLDDQMLELEARRRMEKAARDAESQRVLGDVMAYNTAAEQRKHDQLRELEAMRKERAREMTETKARHDQVREERRMEEQREIDKVKKQQADDYERMMQRKRDNHVKMKLWRAENENNLAEKKRLKQQEQQADRDFARKAQEALEAAEERRLEELRQINVKMKARGVLGDALGESNAAIAAEDEARMLRIQEEARKKAEAEYQEKQRKEAQKKQDIRNTLDRQIQEAVARKQEEEDARQKQAEIFKREAYEAQLELQRQEEARRQAQSDYRMQLEDQLRYGVKLRPTRELMMSDVERKINKTFKPS